MGVADDDVVGQLVVELGSGVDRELGGAEAAGPQAVEGQHGGAQGVGDDGHPIAAGQRLAGQHPADIEQSRTVSTRITPACW